MIKHLISGVVKFGEFAAFSQAVQQYNEHCADKGLQTYALYANQSAGLMNEVFFEANFDDEAALQRRDGAENDDPELMKALFAVISHCVDGSIYDRRLTAL